jgi:hypothetical protein
MKRLTWVHDQLRLVSELEILSSILSMIIAHSKKVQDQGSFEAVGLCFLPNSRYRSVINK